MSKVSNPLALSLSKGELPKAAMVRQACLERSRRAHHERVDKQPLGIRLAVAIFLAVGVLLLSSGIALAHAAFVRSEPAPNSVLSEPPGAVTIWFTEPIEPGLSEIIVLDTTGKRVNTENATVLPNDPKALTVRLPRLPDGTYIVAFKTFSRVDGHSLSGSFIFSIGITPSAIPATPAAPGLKQPLVQSPVEVMVRWLGWLSILAIVGCLVFELFISRPVLSSESSNKAMQGMDRRLQYRTLNFLWLAAGILFVASFGELLTRTSAASGVPLFQLSGRPLVSVLHTGWGNLWFWRMVMLNGMLVVLALASLERSSYRLSGGRKWQIVVLALSAGCLFTFSLVSHGAANTEIRTAAIFSDYLHLLAGSVWVGGLLYLALIVPPVMKAHRAQVGDERLSDTGAGLFCPTNHAMAIGRFSTLALLSVGTLFITGLFNSWAQVTVFRALATPYGITLLTKIGLIIPLLILGAVERLWVRPRLRRDVKAIRLLRKTVTVEAVFAVLVLLSVGFMTSMEPARQVASRRELLQPNRLVLQTAAEGINIKAIVAPGMLGLNIVTINLADRSGRPVTDATSVILTFTYLDRYIGEYTVSAIDRGGGVWVAQAGFFNVEGNWQASLVTQRPGAFDARTSFRFRIPFASDKAVITPSAETGNRLWGMELILLGCLFGGMGLYTGRRKTRSGMVMMVCGSIAILVGGFIVIVSLLA